MSALLLALLLASCGDEVAPEVGVPSWANVAPEQIAEAKKHGVPVAFENELGMKFVLIPAGTFLMGEKRDAAPSIPSANWMYQIPQHEVAIARPYYMQTTEVTNAQYRKFKSEHVSGDRAGLTLDANDQPVVFVTWDDAAAFCRWASGRLPTEAEWERAARGGLGDCLYPWGNKDDVSRRNANGADDGFEQTAPVGQYPPNAFGLYDMAGNVWEWCADEWEEPEPPEGWRPIVVTGSEARTLPHGPERVIRGGSWMFPTGPRSCTSRSATAQDFFNIGIGFRLVVPLPETGE